MSVTIRDIARELGISHTTVYRVVNGKPYVSEETRKKVLKKIEELNYRPNVIARGLTSKRTSFIGVIVPNVGSSCFYEAIEGIEDVLHDVGYDMILCTTREREDVFFDKLTMLKDKMVEGIIIAPGLCCSEKIQGVINETHESGLPVCVFNVLLKNVKAPNVVNDNVRGAYMATQHLVNLGHRKILHIHGPSSDLTSRHKFEGYYKALSDSVIDFNTELVHVVNGYSRQDGYDAICQVLSKGVEFTAVFAFCDELALGVYKALKDHGLRVPDDVSLIGYDNSDYMEINEVPLTSVHYDKRRVGVLAAQVILDKLQGQEGASQIIEPQLVVRESCREL